MSSASSSVPRDAAALEALLRAQGIDKFEPQVLNQLLELQHRMVTELVEDARDYADHADRDDIQPADLALVVQNHVNFQSAQPPPREAMLALAAERNRMPLPLLNHVPKGALPLPHDRFALTQPNYVVDLSMAHPSASASAAIAARHQQQQAQQQQ